MTAPHQRALFICARPGTKLTDQEEHVLKLFLRWLKDREGRCPVCMHKRKNHGRCGICECEAAENGQ